MTNKVVVPHPGTSTEDYERMVRMWAAYTGLQPNDPYVLITAHVYGLYEQIGLSGNNEVLAAITQLSDRLNQFESPESSNGLDPKAAKTLTGITKQLAGLEQRLNKIENMMADMGKTSTWEAIQTQIILILRGTAILLRRQKDEAKKLQIEGVAGSASPGSAESANLTQAIGQSGYKFVPTRAQKFGSWFTSFTSDLNARYFLNLLAILVGCGVIGVTGGIGMKYAQSNRFFDRPAAAPTPSASPPVDKK